MICKSTRLFRPHWTIRWRVMNANAIDSGFELWHTPVQSCFGERAQSLMDRVWGYKHWPFVRGIHRSPVNCPHKGQWRGALVFCLICVWINGWVNNREAGDLRPYRPQYDITVMCSLVNIWTGTVIFITDSFRLLRYIWNKQTNILKYNGMVYMEMMLCA